MSAMRHPIGGARVSAAEGALAVQRITTAAGLEALGPEWWELWRSDPRATPFQSPAWLIPWWRNIGKGQLLTVALRAGGVGGRLVGLLPVFVYAQPHSGSRDILPVGVATSDYLDGLFAAGWEREGAAAALAALEGACDRWDACELTQLRADSPLLTVEMPGGWTEERTAAEACPVLALPAWEESAQPGVGRESAEERLAWCVPGRMLQNLRYYRKRAERLGEVRVEAAETGTLEEIYAAHLALHGARWRERGEAGVMEDAGVRAAQGQSLPELLREDLLRFYALRIDGRIVATLLGLLDKPGPGRRFYYYLGGFDPAYRQISPGTLLIGHAVERALAEEATAFDFLRGGEPYKYLWGAVDQPLYRRVLRHGGGCGGLRIRGAGPVVGDAPLEEFAVQVAGVIRGCRAEDLPALEWFGVFGAQRALLERTFERHERGEAVMLVAEVNGAASGQAWIDLDREREESVGMIWAVRVFPALQGQGIGSRLIGACERVLRGRGCRLAEITVERGEDRVRRLYERLGYREKEALTCGQIVMRKSLSGNAGI